MNQQLLALALVQMAGMMSPGPTAVLMVRHGAGGGRSLGYWMALGITAASALHISISAAGLAELIVRNGYLAVGLRYAGSLYLGYLGIKLLVARLRATRSAGSGSTGATPAWASAISFRQGFLTNLLNPKVTLLYLALFGQLASASSSRATVYLLGGVFIAQSLVYWSLFAALVGSPWFRRQWERWSGGIEMLFGFALLGFGVRLLIGS